MRLRGWRAVSIEIPVLDAFSSETALGAPTTPRVGRPGARCFRSRRPSKKRLARQSVRGSRDRSSWSVFGSVSPIRNRPDLDRSARARPRKKDRESSFRVRRRKTFRLDLFTADGSFIFFTSVCSTLARSAIKKINHPAVGVVVTHGRTARTHRAVVVSIARVPNGGPRSDGAKLINGVRPAKRGRDLETQQHDAKTAPEIRFHGRNVGISVSPKSAVFTRINRTLFPEVPRESRNLYIKFAERGTAVRIRLASITRRNRPPSVQRRIFENQKKFTLRSCYVARRRT